MELFTFAKSTKTFNELSKWIKPTLESSFEIILMSCDDSEYEMQILSNLKKKKHEKSTLIPKEELEKNRLLSVA